MCKRRELLAAGLIKDYRFLNQEEFDLYLYELEHKKIRHEILESVTKQDGTILLRISLGYNQTPLIHLYEN